MIYFTRHGLTEYNKQQRFQGRLDIPLCPEGIAQAEAMAEKLKDIHIDIIYTSPLKRTVKTAEIVNKYHNAEIIVTDALIEFDVGRFVEGKTLAELPENIHAKLYDENKNYFGEEDIKAFRDKVFGFLRSLESTDKDYLLVSHGGVYTQIEQHLIGELKAEEIDNCSPVALTKNGTNTFL